MNAQRPDFSELSSEKLISSLSTLVSNERRALVASIWQLGELKERGHLGDYANVWDFCSRKLRLSNGCCTARSHAVELFRKFPVIAEYVADGRVSFRKVMILENVFTKANVLTVLEEASRSSEYDVKKLVAKAFPQPAVPDKLRKRRSASAARTSSGEVAPTIAPTPTFSSRTSSGEVAPAIAVPRSTSHVATLSAPSFAVTTTAESPAMLSTSTGTSALPAPPPAVPATSSTTVRRQGSDLELPLFTGVPANPRSKDVMRPLNETDTEIGFSCDDEFVALFKQAKSLLSHKFPRRGHAEVLGECLRIAIDVILKKKLGVGERRSPRPKNSESNASSTTVTVGEAKITSPGEVTTPAPLARAMQSATDAQCEGATAPASTSSGEVTQSASHARAAESATHAHSSTAPTFTSPDEVTRDRSDEFFDPPVPPDLFVRPSRCIPKPLMRKIWERDGGCCSFLLEDGTRCGSTYQVEVDHDEPYALGGPATEANLRLACGPHNRRRGREFFGTLGQRH